MFNGPVVFEGNSTENQKPRILSRIEWLAQPPTKPLTPLKTPVSLIVIHDTSTEPCTTEGSCIFTVRYLQVFHVESRQLWDIGFNFVIGGDCSAYEGRGWKKEGAHTYGFNYMSLGVAFVGSFSQEIPPQNQTDVFHQLIAMGLELGYIAKDYKIMAARQLESIESPGVAFYKEIQTWSRWSTKIP